MRTVTAEATFAASTADAQALWCDTGRWVEWVDGLERIVAVDGDWPRAGATVTWQSGPAGRGRVTERVLAYGALEGQTVKVADDSIHGEQAIAFIPDGADVRVTLALAYALNRRSPITAVVDLLFIRRAMATALEHTLERFGVSLKAVAAPNLDSGR